MEKDPEDRLLWSFPRRRLSGEEIRDAMLVASGKLNDKARGPSIVLPVDADAKTRRFFALFAGKVMDGVALYFALQQGTAIPDGAQAVLPSFQAWVEELLGTLKPKTPRLEAPAWQPELLEYKLEVLASAGDGSARSQVNRPTVPPSNGPVQTSSCP